MGVSKIYALKVNEWFLYQVIYQFCHCIQLVFRLTDLKITEMIDFLGCFYCLLLDTNSNGPFFINDNLVETTGAMIYYNDY